MRRLFDFTQVGIGRRRRRQLHLRQTGIAENTRQQIVEIVRDAARQHPQAFELLHVQHLRLQLATLVFDVLALQLRPGARGKKGEEVAVFARILHRLAVENRQHPEHLAA